MPSSSTASGTASDALLREVFEVSADAILILDGGILVDCNRAALRMLGYTSKDDLLPVSLWELSPAFQPDGRSSAEKAHEMIRIALDRKFHRFEWVHIRADGKEFPVEVTLTAVHLDGRRVLHVVWRDLTEQKLIEQRFRNVAHITTDVIWDWDLQTDAMWWSDGMQRQFGYLPEELEPDARSWTEHIHPEDRERVTQVIQAFINGQESEWKDEYRFLRHDGTSAEIVDRGTVIRDSNGKPLRMVGGMTDVTEQRRYERQLHQAAHILASTREAVTITDADKRILSVNQAFTDITGYTEAEVLGKTPNILSSGRHDRQFYQAMWQSIMETGRWQGEIWNRRKSGEIYPEWLAISAVHDEQGNIINYVGVFSDISQIKQSEENIERLKNYDPLTGLPNRTLLMTLLRLAIKRAEREQGMASLLYCNIDRFKPINDSLGHQAGDEVLQVMANRLRQRLRAGDILARLGADEFIVLIESLSDQQAASRLARDLIHCADEPIRLSNGTELNIGLSIGIAIFPADAQDAEFLLQCADAAMIQAKQGGKEHYSFYAPAMTELAHERLQLEAELRHALKTGQLTVYFQPVLAVAGENIVGAEALVRWRHPDKGLIPPDRFIPLAEETGLVGLIGEQVLHQACAAVAKWHATGCRDFRLAVNVSAMELADRGIIDRIRSVLADTGLDPAVLEIELTERVFMARNEQTRIILQELGDLGIRLAIDDFGTGYSSLAYLQDIAADTLKIDRRFISKIPADPRSRQIASTIIAMGRSMCLDTVAEGVETRAQLDWLKEQGCDLFQGYLVSPPVPAGEFEKLLLDCHTE